jgi:hypothetical protein
MQNKHKSIGYWAATIIIAAALTAGGCAQLANVPDTVAGIRHLGYPLYVLTILGTWKLLGAACLLAPRLPQLKEWAYAGIFFDLTGAALSHAFSGDGAGVIAMPLVLLLVAMVSWALRPASRLLGPQLGANRLHEHVAQLRLEGNEQY